MAYIRQNSTERDQKNRPTGSLLVTENTEGTSIDTSETERRPAPLTVGARRLCVRECVGWRPSRGRLCGSLGGREPCVYVWGRRLVPEVGDAGGDFGALGLSVGLDESGVDEHEEVGLDGLFAVHAEESSEERKVSEEGDENVVVFPAFVGKRR